MTSSFKNNLTSYIILKHLIQVYLFSSVDLNVKRMSSYIILAGFSFIFKVSKDFRISVLEILEIC